MKLREAFEQILSSLSPDSGISLATESDRGELAALVQRFTLGLNMCGWSAMEPPDPKLLDMMVRPHDDRVTSLWREDGVLRIALTTQLEGQTIRHRSIIIDALSLRPSDRTKALWRAAAPINEAGRLSGAIFAEAEFTPEVWSDLVSVFEALGVPVEVNERGMSIARWSMAVFRRRFGDTILAEMRP